MKSVLNYLVQAIAFLLLNEAVTTAHGLSEPYRVTYSIFTDSIRVRWRHSEQDEPNHGYYISVQELQSGQKLGKPDFVHVDEGVRSAVLRGFKPYAVYEIKVIAYSDEEHKSSSPVLIRTDQLKFLQAYDTEILDITAERAVFRWKHDPDNNIHGVSFRVSCTGRQVFKRNGETVEDVTSFRHTTQATSALLQTYTVRDLVPNTNYNCHILSVAGKRVSKPRSASAIEFKTAPGKPSVPPKPKIDLTTTHGKEKATSFTVKLFPADYQFGPVDHYRVYAVPVYKSPGQPASAPFRPKVPSQDLPSHAVSSYLVSQVDEAIPFIIGEYEADALPEDLMFDGQWMSKAFKSQTHYSVVVTAFAKRKDSDDDWVTYSDLANPPVYIGTDMQRQWVQERKPVARRFTLTVLITMFTVLVLFSVAFILAFGSNYFKAKKRDAHFFSIVDSSDESSEDEVVVTKPPPKDELQLPKNPVYYPPAFSSLVYRSPETEKEMEEMLELIAQTRRRRSQAANRRKSEEGVEEAEDGCETAMERDHDGTVTEQGVERTTPGHTLSHSTGDPLQCNDARGSNHGDGAQAMERNSKEGNSGPSSQRHSGSTTYLPSQRPSIGDLSRPDNQQEVIVDMEPLLSQPPSRVGRGSLYHLYYGGDEDSS